MPRGAASSSLTVRPPTAVSSASSPAALLEGVDEQRGHHAVAPGGDELALKQVMWV